MVFDGLFSQDNNIVLLSCTRQCPECSHDSQIHVNLNTILYAHVQQSPTKMEKQTHMHAHTHAHTHTHTHTHTHVAVQTGKQDQNHL